MFPMKLMTQTSDGDKREVTMISTYLSHYVDHFAECVEYSRIGFLATYMCLQRESA